MSLQGTIHRYSIILDQLSRSRCPSFSDLKEHLFDQGFEVSERTIQRDIEQIRNEFGIDVAYDRSTNGYYIEEENSPGLHTFLRFLYIVRTGLLLADSLKDSREAMKYISFEYESDSGNVFWLSDLMSAIREHRKVRFNHINFHTDTQKVFTISPYLLREYQGRWYVIGKVDRLGELRTFGMDRILELEILETGFSPPAAEKVRALFDHVIGLVYSEGEITEVELSFTPVQGRYIKSLPLHTSQEVIIDNQEEVRVRLTVIPNYELIQKILSHGDRVKVIRPECLADEVMGYLERALGRYGKK